MACRLRVDHLPVQFCKFLGREAVNEQVDDDLRRDGAVAVEVLLSVGTAHAGGPPTVRIPNPGTLVLLTTGLGALAWWTRGRR